VIALSESFSSDLVGSVPYAALQEPETHL